MIISHKHKFIFIKTEKTAGTSFEIALSKICGEQDIITPISPKDEEVRQKLGYRGPQNYLFPFKNYTRRNWFDLFRTRRWQGFFNHISALEIKRHVPLEVWKTYYRFCFERNPYDKVVSLFFWTGKNKYKSILELIRSGEAGKIKGFDLYSSHSLPLVDKVYKYEEMDTALADISAKLNLETPLTMPEYKAKSDTRVDKRHYREILTPEEADWIAKIFAREIKFFGYEF